MMWFEVHIECSGNSADFVIQNSTFPERYEMVSKK